MRLPIWRIPLRAKKCFSKIMTLLLVLFMMLLMREHLSKSKNIEIAHKAWKKLDESFEGTKAIKGAKAYILKEKFVASR